MKRPCLLFKKYADQENIEKISGLRLHDYLKMARDKKVKIFASVIFLDIPDQKKLHQLYSLPNPQFFLPLPLH